MRTATYCRNSTKKNPFLLGTQSSRDHFYSKTSENPVFIQIRIYLVHFLLVCHHYSGNSSTTRQTSSTSIILVKMLPSFRPSWIPEENVLCIIFVHAFIMDVLSNVSLCMNRIDDTQINLLLVTMWPLNDQMFDWNGFISHLQSRLGTYLWVNRESKN